MSRFDYTRRLDVLANPLFNGDDVQDANRGYQTSASTGGV